MANSTRKSILDYLKNTTLALITTGSGYNYTLGNIERGIKEIDSLPDSKFPAVFIVTSSENRENITRQDFRSILSVAMEGYVKRSGDVSGIQSDLDNLIEDVTKAVESDRTLGGNCKSLEIRDITSDDGDLGEYGAFRMIVELMYASKGTTP